MTPVFTTEEAREGWQHAFTKSASKKEAEGLTQEQLESAFHDARAEAFVEDVTKMASKISDPSFLEGFASRCVDAGLSEEEMLKQASGLFGVLAMADAPHFTRELGRRVSPQCPA